jgi:two-component system, NtrC family, nitrogen regulation response regulator NtrX
MAHILIVDDEAGIRDTLAMIFEYEQHRVTTAESGLEALKILESSDPVDCILLDVKMPGIDGLETIERLKVTRPEIPVIMISGHGTIETAVEATRRGAFDFLEKPPDRQKLLLLVRNAIEKRHLVTENRVMREKLRGKETMLGRSEAMRNIRAIIERVAPTEARVLITGENGSGKELVARAIHRHSKRADRPFVEVNCAAIPKDLIESELFGHEKGSFTGAQAQRIGKFEQADTGTLFLDEVGDMHLEAQAKMLRVIEEHRLERVGSSTGRPIPINVRILAATNKNLPEEIRQGRFREDLFHRLNVIPIYVPPLRERREDIPMLVKAFSEEFCQQMNRKAVTFEEEAMQLLVRLPYTGNIRELRNVIERIVILTNADVVTKDDVERLGLAFSMQHTGSSQNDRSAVTQQPASYAAPQAIEIGGNDATSFTTGDSEDDDLSKSVILTPKDRERLEAIERGDSPQISGYSLLSDEHDPLKTAMQADTFQEFKDRAEKAYIEERLREHNWNISRTADALDIQRSHLYTKMRKYGLMKDKHHDEPEHDEPLHED